MGASTLLGAPVWMEGPLPWLGAEGLSSLPFLQVFGIALRVPGRELWFEARPGAPSWPGSVEAGLGGGREGSRGRVEKPERGIVVALVQHPVGLPRALRPAPRNGSGRGGQAGGLPPGWMAQQWEEPNRAIACSLGRWSTALVAEGLGPN